MCRPGTCDTGCAEHKLPLVRGATLDALSRAEEIVLAGIRAWRPTAEELLQPPADRDWQAAYTNLQEHARAARLNAPDDRRIADVLEAPAEPAITWWCDRCDGIDAPQPCLGICVWRTIDWVLQDIYRQQRERTQFEWEAARRLRSVMLRVLHTHPRPGQHQRSWEAFAEEAATVLNTARAPGGAVP